MAVREIMTPEQVAEYLQINPATVCRYIRQGKIVAFRVGPQYRIPWENLELFLLALSTVRPGLREYSAEDAQRFMEADRIDPQTREMGQNLLRGLQSAQ